MLTIGKALTQIERGKIKRLMIAVPPRHGKSLLASQLFPAWYLGRNPSRQIIAATYAQELADDFGRNVRNIMRDPLFAKIFPGVVLRDDSTSAKRFHTSAGGIYVAAGVGGPLTGRGADLLLIDDPIKNREEAESETFRRQMRDWYTSVAYTRLMPDAAVVVIQTRWHASDLAGWLLSDHGHEGWTVVDLPALSEDGIALWPERYPAQRLEQIKQTIGSRDFSALYQQRPSPAEGGLIHSKWFSRYSVAPIFSRVIQSWDTAHKAAQINDPSVCTTWGQTSTGYYLLDVYRVRAEYPELKRAALSLASKWDPSVILIEDKASGQSLVQDLRQTTNMPILPVNPQGDKVIRLMVVSPLFESGRVFLPESAPWLIDYEMELTQFPSGAHDDQVDSSSQALKYLAHQGATGFLDYIDSESA